MGNTPSEPPGRLHRPGLRTLLVTMTVSLVAASMLAGHWNTTDILDTAVYDREIDKAATVGRLVGGLIETESARLASVAELVQAHPEVVATLARGNAAADPKFVQAVNRLQRALRLDTLEFVDLDEKVVYRTIESGPREARAGNWALSEALDGKSGLAVVRDSLRVTIEASAPLSQGVRRIGALSAGIHIDQNLMSRVAHEAGAMIALLNHRALPLATSHAVMPDPDIAAVEDTFSRKIPFARVDRDTKRATLYVPLLLVDEAFVLQVVSDGAGAGRLLDQSTRKSGLMFAAILAVAVIASLMLLRLGLAPLTRLRRKAEDVALEATGQHIDARRSDEIGSVVHVLDTLTGRLIGQNRALAEARDAAIEASAAKSTFLSSMSHEIRTPLNGVLGMADLLRRTELAPDQRRYCDAIVASGRQLHGLLSDVLDLAKIEAGKLTLEAIDFDFAAVVRDLAVAFHDLAAERGTRFVEHLDSGVPAHLHGDPTRLRQVLSNLLGNALKFTEGGEIGLSIATTRPAGPASDPRIWLRIEVRDTGIGIPAEKLRTLFKPFTQADGSTTRTHGGTGLGLAICRSIVELMGGTIAIASEAGAGTTVTLDVPFAVATAASPAPQAAAIPGGRLAGRVLVAEDNAVNQIVIGELLTGFGLAPTIVDDGRKAVAALAGTESYDLVFMDCQMPGMDGYTATARIRAAESGRRIPIVALTANAFAEDRQRCLDAGMDDYLSKPMTAEALYRVATRWLPASAAPAAAEPVPPQPTPPADAADAARLLDATTLAQLATQVSPRIARRAAQAFLDSAPALAGKLRAAADGGNLRDFGLHVHALKSSSRTLGAHRMADLAAEAEKLARAGDTRAWALRDALLQTLDATCVALADAPLLDAAAA